MIQTSKIWFPSHVPAPDSHFGRLTVQLPKIKVTFSNHTRSTTGTISAIPEVEIFQQYFKLCLPDFRLGRGSNLVVFLDIFKNRDYCMSD